MKILKNQFEIIIDGEGQKTGSFEIKGYVFVTMKNCWVESGSGRVILINDNPPPSETFQTIFNNKCTVCHNHGVVYGVEEHEERIKDDNILRFYTNLGRNICPNCLQIMKN